MLAFGLHMCAGIAFFFFLVVVVPPRYFCTLTLRPFFAFLLL